MLRLPKGKDTLHNREKRNFAEKWGIREKGGEEWGKGEIDPGTMEIKRN